MPMKSSASSSEDFRKAISDVVLNRSDHPDSDGFERDIDVEKINRLLQNNPDLIHHRFIEGATPLHRAAGNLLPKLCRLFLQVGADISCQDDHQQTPLHWAVGQDQEHEDVRMIETVKVLLDHKADPLSVDANGQTPIYLSMVYGLESKVFHLLTDHVPQWDLLSSIRSGKPVDEIHQRLKNTSSLKSHHLKPGVLLHEALDWGGIRYSMGDFIQLIRLLMEHGEDVNAVQDNISPIYNCTFRKILCFRNAVAFSLLR